MVTTSRRFIWLMAATLLTLLRAEIAQSAESYFRVAPDQGATNCLADDQTPGILVAYVCAFSDEGDSGAAFRLDVSPGFTGVLNTVEYLSGAWGIGDPFQGLEIAYFTCSVGLRPLIKATFTTFGTSQNCSFITLAASNTREVSSPVVFRCNSVIPVDARVATPLAINLDDSCDLCILATQTSTWGHVKALYR